MHNHARVPFKVLQKIRHNIQSINKNKLFSDGLLPNWARLIKFKTARATEGWRITDLDYAITKHANQNFVTVRCSLFSWLSKYFVHHSTLEHEPARTANDRCAVFSLSPSLYSSLSPSPCNLEMWGVSAPEKPHKKCHNGRGAGLWRKTFFTHFWHGMGVRQGRNGVLAPVAQYASGPLLIKQKCNLTRAHLEGIGLRDVRFVRNWLYRESIRWDWDCEVGKVMNVQCCQKERPSLPAKERPGNAGTVPRHAAQLACWSPHLHQRFSVARSSSKWKIF